MYECESVCAQRHSMGETCANLTSHKLSRNVLMYACMHVPILFHMHAQMRIIVSVCVCVCIYIYIYIYIYMYTYISAGLLLSVTRSCMKKNKNSTILVYVKEKVCTRGPLPRLLTVLYVCMHVGMYACMCVFVCIYVCLYVYIHIYGYVRKKGSDGLVYWQYSMYVCIYE